jgi:RNA polymerase sigma factor for flagellar operon FliA
MTPEQEKLVEEHMPFVRMIAGKMKACLPKHVDLDDMVSAGYCGLCQAALRWDTSKGERFRAYASYRVRGEMIDYLRSTDWVPKKKRTEANKKGTELAVMLSIDETVHVGEEKVPYSDLISDGRDPIELGVADRDHVDRVMCALNIREQFVIMMMYRYHQTLDTIGKMLGVSQSRACQMHTASLEKMREVAAACAA